MKRIVWLLILFAAVGLAVGRAETDRLRQVFDGITLDSRFDPAKIALYPWQTLSREEPAAHPECQSYRDQGYAHTKYVYVLRARAASSLIKIGVGFEERILWKTSHLP